MSCNSTYLLDGKTDHGAKVDELVTLLDEVFERPEAKAVVFSQWVATHELIIRRLKKRGWGYALFHGGVPSEQRGGLVDRFHADPACRVGLNLQHAAAIIINMGLPWNPAIIEQRIGRVHRLGQSKSVQVVNFVAEGTIEEKMLSILAFKKSLFAGVLDGGEVKYSWAGRGSRSSWKAWMRSRGAMRSRKLRRRRRRAWPPNRRWKSRRRSCRLMRIRRRRRRTKRMPSVTIPGRRCST